MRIARLMCWSVVAAALLMAGCLSARKRPEPPPPPPDRPINAAEVYTLACPDLIEVIFLDWPELSRTTRIAADGMADLGNLGRVRVEGDTIAEAARRIADRAEVPPRRLRVQVVEYNSRQILVYGQVNGEPRVVDYRGPETVAELLRRVGGLTPDASPSEVHIVRAQLGEGIPAEVLQVDLVAILEKKDERTNIRVAPLDEIYIGEMARSRIGKLMPPILKPIYDSVVAFIPTRRSDAARQDENTPPVK
ncbi:MAG: polysaccharide biosynthesis/export family protein [Gemmataceae bacterium]